MTRALSKLLTAGLAIVLLGGVATPVVAQADSTTDTVTTATNASDEVTLNVSAVETPYILISTTDGIKKTPAVSGWPDSLTTTQLSNDDYMAKLIAATPENNKDSAENVRTAMTTLTSAVTANPNEPYVTSVQKSLGATQYTADEFLGLMMPSSYMQFWNASMYAHYQAGLMDRDAMIKDYDENVRPELIKLGVNNTIISTYDPANITEKMFNEKILDFYKQDYERISSSPTFSGISKEQFLKLDPTGTINEQIKLWKAPLSAYYTKLADGTYKVSGLLSGGLSFFDFGTTPSIIPTPAKSQPVTVHYVDDQGKTLAADKTLTGDLNAAYQSDALTITGYKLTQTPANATGKFTSDAQTVTYVYTKQGTLQTGSAADTIEPIAAKGTVVYATKKVGLYKTATFSKKARKQWYVKKSRMNRPMFVVTGYATSKNGVKRYRVKDVNHRSATAGKTGYLTTNRAYTTPVYYAAKHKTVTVINPAGVNSYAKKTLTGKKTHYQQGQVLTVKKIVTHKLTTRFVLSNGRYITANKKLVQAGKITMPSKVTVKRAINRYGNANLTTKNKAIKRGTTLKIRGWRYSNANNFSKHDTLRYHVAGGYITANPHFVKAIR
ncbi:DUF5776 domain-containing protein [Levilactobacillus cerevisiae]|uniref:DUF5776 domain-containing protein n=1 Tax=Levilactobacillus cerevisiae TaxID=1704076 RepID=UPI000F772B9A|nr:DUF5776 domain-containing protein [Levilactobacillus cerevisiae]